MRVSLFRHLRISGYLLLPAAFRSLSRLSSFLEAGAQTNTVQEVKNAMEPFADILDKVLQG